MLRRDGDEKTAGSLRIEEKILIFGRDARFERGALADEGAIVFQATGKMAFAGGFDGAWKIAERCVIDFEGDRLQAMCWIAERHLASVTEKTEAGHVGYGVNGFRALKLFVELLEGCRGGGIESTHGSYGGGQ